MNKSRKGAPSAVSHRTAIAGRETEPGQDVRRILGVSFYIGEVDGAIARVCRGGLLVVPAAPALKDIAVNSRYREALTHADVVIPDSAFMVLAWNLIERDSISRLSGLKYLRELLKREDVCKSGSTFWIMARRESAKKNLDWLESHGVAIPNEFVYDAPMYGSDIEDESLITHLKRLRPKHIVITLGGGTQECLGLYLKRQLDYHPAIHCIGAAIAFLSGDQVRIPDWADRLYLGWLLRCLSSPKNYVRRYAAALKLFPMIWRHRSELPA